MTIHLELNEATSARIQQVAETQGVEPEEVVKNLLESTYRTPVPTDPDVIIARMNEFAERFGSNTPILSEYAMSRESMYDNERLQP